MLQKRGSLVIFSFLSSAFGIDRHTVYGVNSVPFKNVATHTHTSVQILPHLVLHCPTQQMYVYVCKSTRVTRLHKLSATRKLHSHTHTHIHHFPFPQGLKIERSESSAALFLLWRRHKKLLYDTVLRFLCHVCVSVFMSECMRYSKPLLQKCGNGPGVSLPIRSRVS